MGNREEQWFQLKPASLPYCLCCMPQHAHFVIQSMMAKIDWLDNQLCKPVSICILIARMWIDII